MYQAYSKPSKAAEVRDYTTGMGMMVGPAKVYTKSYTGLGLAEVDNDIGHASLARQKELAELYLGPKQSKNKENKNKRKRGSQSEESSPNMSEDEDKNDPETPPKKKRNLYKKFPLPLTRMSDIALDANLTDEPVNHLTDIGRMLRDRCSEALEHVSDTSKNVEIVKFGKVSVNPKTLIETESLLRPIGKLMPDVGIWEQLKPDRDLDLGGEILLNANCKPPAKHLDVRAAYLLRMLQRKSKDVKVGKKKKQKKLFNFTETDDDPNKEDKSKEIIEDEDSSDYDGRKKVKKKEKRKDEKKKEKPNKSLVPVRIRSNELLKSDLDPATFPQNKENMRNVKKSLEALDKTDPNQTPEEKVRLILISLVN